MNWEHVFKVQENLIQSEVTLAAYAVNLIQFKSFLQQSMSALSPQDGKPAPD